jgi:hypothetical protein
MSAGPSSGTPNIRILYFNDLRSSIAFFRATISDPKVLDSTVFCFLECCHPWIYTVLRRYPCNNPLDVEELGTSSPLCIDGITPIGQTGGNVGSCVLVFVAQFPIRSSSDLPAPLASHLTSSPPFGTSVLWVSHERLLQTEPCNLLSIVVRTPTHCKFLLEPIPGP